MVYGRKHGRSVGRIYTHQSAQCSPASVGLAQACPKNLGIRLRLEIVGKINAYTSDILPNSEHNTSRDLQVGGDILGRGDLNIMEIK